jgi:hypothetical protein
MVQLQIIAPRLRQLLSIYSLGSNRLTYGPVVTGIPLVAHMNQTTQT